MAEKFVNSNFVTKPSVVEGEDTGISQEEIVNFISEEIDKLKKADAGVEDYTIDITIWRTRTLELSKKYSRIAYSGIDFAVNKIYEEEDDKKEFSLKLELLNTSLTNSSKELLNDITDDKHRKFCFKLLDYVSLSLAKYSDTAKKDHSLKDLDEKRKRLEKNIQASETALNKLDEKLNNHVKEILTFMGIFTAISFVFNSGVSILNNINMQITNSALYFLLLSGIGLLIVDIFWLFLYTITSLVSEQVSNAIRRTKYIFVFANVGYFFVACFLISVALVVNFDAIHLAVNLMVNPNTPMLNSVSILIILSIVLFFLSNWVISKLCLAVDKSTFYIVNHSFESKQKYELSPSKKKYVSEFSIFVSILPVLYLLINFIVFKGVPFCVKIDFSKLLKLN